jgi:hypothetical protein
MIAIWILAGIAVTLAGAAIALRGRGALRVAGVLLALLPAHLAYYDSRLRGCFNETCDRADYLIPLLFGHFAALLTAAAWACAAALRRRRGRDAALAVVAVALAWPAVTGEAQAARYECGSAEFPGAALRSPYGAERSGSGPARALRRFIRAEKRLDGPQAEFARPRWRRLVREPGLAVFGGAGRRGMTDTYVEIERRDGRWAARRWGQCTPERVVTGSEVVGWTLHPRADVRPGTRGLRVLLETGSCDPSPEGQRRSAARPHRIVVRGGRRSLKVLVLLEPEPLPPDGFCSDIGLTIERTLRLPEPVGRRALRDARTYPTTVVRGPPR